MILITNLLEGTGMHRVVAVRLVAVVVALVLSVAVGSAAGQKKYGKELTLKETTKISDIYASPDKFNGKRVQVKGPIVEVCEEMGCWIEIGSDKEFEALRFKVDDGVIVFPMTIKGSNATVEGVLSVTTLSVAEQIAQGQEMAKERKTTFDPKTVKGPKVSIQIKGEGAIVS
jgi:hypothetical protein